MSERTGFHKTACEPAATIKRIAYEREHRTRKREVRKLTVSFARSSFYRLANSALGLTGDEAPVRRHLPMLRASCESFERPCPFVSCKHHLFLDTSAKGTITLNFPDLEPDQLPHSCALDVANGGGATLEEVGEIMNLTRERVRQIEASALRKLRALRRLPR